MHFSSVATSLLGLVSVTTALQLPQDHYLWGAKGPAGATLDRRAKPKTSSTSTHSVAKSTSSTSVQISSTPSSVKVSSTLSSTSSIKPVSVSSTSTKVPDAFCTNGPLTRSCWSNGYSIATDFDLKWPTTGVTRKYNLELVNGTCNPDGSKARECLLWNNEYPGPTLIANWGDTFEITVKNSLTGNGTSVHWHGLRQLNTNTQDGVNGITECPLAPGDTKTYKFLATQFGTTWFHSHYSAQYGDGAIGSIIINGPATSNYDIDLGTYALNEWYYQTAYQVNDIAEANLQKAQGPPPGDNLLINGTNKSPSGTGSYSKVTLQPGKKYRLRLINTSVDSQIRVSLDNHPFTVITSDFVPIHPYTTNWVLLAIGQRYDVIFTANQTVGNYWFRSEIATDCASANNYFGRGVFSYVGAPSGDPTSSAATIPTVCQDEQNLVPWVNNTVPKDLFASQVGNLEVDLTQEQVTTNGQNIVAWGINLTAIDVDWDMPTLEYVKEGNTSYPVVFNLIEIPNPSTWSFWIVQETPGTPVPIPHPIHLHGHDFYVLGTGTGTYDTNTSINTLTFNNPPRRDTALLPGGGWLVIAFETDNPGAWLMHCHIAWHISSGLGVQFLESKSDIVLPDSAWETTCANWRKYFADPVYNKTDSGL